MKFFNDAEKAALTQKLAIEEGDLILFAADQWLNACEILGKIRLYCADVLKAQGKLTIPADRFDFLWVVDFPLLSFDKEQNRWYSSHHPFTAPVAEDIPLLKTDPKKVRGQHYDIVVNGVELGGGSIRIHQPDVQKTVFEEVLQIPPDMVKARFGYMLEAFRYGAPPHGGIALGFDRLIAILCGTPSIRDVIAFPENRQGHLFDDRLARQRGAEATARFASGIESGEEGISAAISMWPVGCSCAADYFKPRRAPALAASRQRLMSGLTLQFRAYPLDCGDMSPLSKAWTCSRTPKSEMLPGFCILHSLLV